MELQWSILIVLYPYITGLVAGERRVETFQFNVPTGAVTDVRAALSYFYSPGERDASRRRITIRTLQAKAF